MKARRSSRQSVQLAAEPSKDQPNPVRMPMISTGSGSIDVMSRLLQDRVLMLNGGVNDEMANVLVAQLLYLANQDSDKDITIYINSPGGSVSAGMAIFDAMQFVPCDVSTVCYGMAASMGAFLLGAGTKGKRRALPNSRIMIHQPLGGAGGQAADMEIQAKEILFLRDILNTYLSDFSGRSLEQVAEDCDPDYFMTPEEAKEYGIIDEVVEDYFWSGELQSKVLELGAALREQQEMDYLLNQAKREKEQQRLKRVQDLEKIFITSAVGVVSETFKVWISVWKQAKLVKAMK